MGSPGVTRTPDRPEALEYPIIPRPWNTRSTRQPGERAISSHRAGDGSSPENGSDLPSDQGRWPQAQAVEDVQHGCKRSARYQEREERARVPRTTRRSRERRGARTMTEAKILSPLDAAFLHIESSRSPMHMASIGLFEKGPLEDEQGNILVDDIRRLVVDRFSLVPKLRQRPQPQAPRTGPTAMGRRSRISTS